MSDFGLGAFKASPLGKAIQPIIEDPVVVNDMEVLARYGIPPVKALDERLAHLLPQVGTREVNSRIGVWAYERIGEDRFEVAGRAKVGGKVFDTGSTFRLRPTEAYRIERSDPRPGGREHPVRGPKGYELVAPGLPLEKRTKGENAVHVATLAEAVPLIKEGYSIRMGRKGVRSSLITGKHLKITRL